FLKPNRASLEMRNKTKPDVFEKYIVNARELCTYAPQSKEIRVFKLESKTGQGSEDNFLTFLFGMKAEDAKKRYQLTLLPPPRPGDEKWYHYIEVVARTPADRADFTRARLVLMASNFLPRQLWFEQPNGNEVTWDFNQLFTGVELR